MRTSLCSLFFSSIITMLLFGGCKNDIVINANYKDVFVCYGLLNPYDTAQYIRIEKVFLGEGSALEMAQHADSIGFLPGRLAVNIEHWFGGNLVNTYPLVPDTTVPRDSGLFQHPYQVIYRGNFPVMNDGSSYKINVTDLVKGKSFSAETYIPENIQMVEPVSTFMPLNLYDTTTIAFRYKSGQYGYRYRMTLRFHYQEQFVFDTTQVSEKYVDWSFTDQDALNNSGGSEMQVSFLRHDFFNMLSNSIHDDPLVRRIAGKLDIIVTGANEELAIYMDVQTANNNSAAALPPYTNISGGYGIFSSRTTNVSRNYLLDQNTHYNLHNDPVTQHLNFIR